VKSPFVIQKTLWQYAYQSISTYGVRDIVIV